MIDEAPQQGEGFDNYTFENDMDAEAHVEKINGWEAFRKRWIEHYEKKIAEVNERADRNIAWHKHFLERFFNTVPHRATATQLSYDLPSCQLVMKKATDKLNKPNAEAMQGILLRMCEHNDTQFVVTKTTQNVDWDSYKKLLTIVDGQVVDMRTGEFVSDVPITHAEQEFVLKFKKEKESVDDGSGNPVT